jgi:RNA polymerase sigma-70 factor (ECF subfamily)
MTVNDEALMRAVREGDLGKLGALFDRYHVALFDFLNRMTGRRDVAEDLVQEVFLRMLKYRATYRDEARFETWAFRIARNARADYFARRERVEPLSDEAMESPDQAPGPESELEQERDAALLRCALMSLREDRRELIILARYQGMKHEAIADLLGVDTGTVKVRIHRALNELRDIFTRMAERSSCDVKTLRRSLSTI